MLFGIALAALIVAPQPRYMWLSNDDTPVSELGGRASVDVKFRLTVAPDGRVHRCDIEQSSGKAPIDQYTCDLARRRALFRPAQSVDGALVFGVYRTHVIWAAVPVSPKPSGDVTLRLTSPPKGVRLPATVHIAFAVDRSGQVSDCVAEAAALPGQHRNKPTLVSLACEQFLKGYSATPARDDNGQPVLSIQNLTVLLSKG